MNNNKEKVSILGLSGESIFMKVDHFNNPGETVVASTYHVEYGGKGYNQAVACARCGCDVSFLTVFGKDEIAKNALKCLEDEHIKCMPIFKDGKSAVACITINKDGDNNVVVYPGVSNDLRTNDVELFKDEIISSDYLLLQLELSDESLYKAISIAKEHQVKVVLNPAPYHDIPIDLLNQCFMLTPNEVECLSLFNLDVVNEETLKSVPHPLVVVTKGKDGALLKIGDDVIKILPRHASCVNTTGAGDTFNGVIVSMLAKGLDIYEALDKAIIASSMSTEKEFVIDAIPHYDWATKLFK